MSRLTDSRRLAGLDDPRWLDSKFRRLPEVGRVGRDLDVLRSRLGIRNERSGKARIPRLASLREQAAIVLLATLVGIVVMLPVPSLVRLREVAWA